MPAVAVMTAAELVAHTFSWELAPGIPSDLGTPAPPVHPDTEES